MVDTIGSLSCIVKVQRLDGFGDYFQTLRSARPLLPRQGPGELGLLSPCESFGLAHRLH